MDIKCVALVVVLLALTVEFTETLPFPGVFISSHLRDQILKNRNAMQRSGTHQRNKRSLEDADMDMEEYLASGLADKPHSRHKRAVFSGNIIVVGIMCGVAGVLCLGALVWTAYMFRYKKHQIGGGTN